MGESAMKLCNFINEVLNKSGGVLTSLLVNNHVKILRELTKNVNKSQMASLRVGGKNLNLK